MLVYKKTTLVLLSVKASLCKLLQQVVTFPFLSTMPKKITSFAFTFALYKRQKNLIHRQMLKRKQH